MKTYIIQDTMEVFFTSTTGSKYLVGLTTETSIARDVEQELIKAGIGSKTVGVINKDNGYKITAKTGVYYDELPALQLGQEFQELSSLKVKEVEEDKDGLVTVKEKTVAGKMLDLKASSFPKNGELQLRTIAYDGETNDIVANIYYIFPKCSPDGGFEQAFGMGTNNVQEIVFTPMIPKGSNSYGKYIVEPIEEGKQEDDDLLGE